MIRKYGRVQYDNDAYALPRSGGMEESVPGDSLPKELETQRRLREMSHFLEIIRNLQSRLSSKSRRPGQVLA